MKPKLELADRVKIKIQELEVAILSASPAGRPLSVMAGACGSILHDFYMAKMQNSQVLYDRAFDLLEHTLDVIEQIGVDYVTYCDGVAGFGVLFQLLVKEGFIDVDANDILPALDQLIVGYTRAQLQAGNIDFLHGAIGNGFYLLNRLGTPETDECLAQVIDYLTTTAVRDAQGIRWYDQPSALNSFSLNHIDLSLAHGLNSKLIFLAQCIKESVKISVCTTLLEGAVHYLKQQANPTSITNIYPSILTASSHPYYSSRLAWCYGDLGVAVALLFAGKVLGNKTWIADAFSVGLRATVRITPKQTGLVDAGLCHGTSGVAHIFNRFYQESGQDEFRLARNYWLEQTLNLATFTDGLAGYKTYQQENWVLDSSLLEGVTGISLALRSCLEEDATNLSWDTLFLLNFS